jgi:glycine cleavage system H protein
MSKGEVRADRRYTKDHEWARSDGDGVAIGITAYAVDQLGDITLVNLDVREGDAVEAGKPFGTVESVKTLADLFAPVSGKVRAVNARLEDRPELVNEDCYGEGWMIVLEPTSPAELDGLLEATAYQAFVAAGGGGH